MTKRQDTKIDVRLSKDLAKAAKKKADRQHRPLSQVIRDLLRNWLQSREDGSTTQT